MSRGTIVSKIIRHRVSLAILACIHNALLGGIIFGWASVDRTILMAEQKDGGAAMSSKETSTIFSWASCISMSSSLILGHILDEYGPRKCSVFACCIIGMGCQLFAMSNEFIGFAISTSLIAFGGPGIAISIVHVANLFTKNKFLVMSLLNGSISMSFAILAIFDLIWERNHSFGYRILFTSHSVVVIACAVVSFFVWPDEPFEEGQKIDHDHHKSKSINNNSNSNDDDQMMSLISTFQNEINSAAYQHNTEKPININCHCRRNVPHHENMPACQCQPLELDMEKVDKNHHNSKTRTTKTTRLLKDQPLRGQVFSFSYLRMLITFVVTSFLANFYVASITTELADFHNFDKLQQHQLAQSLTLLMSIGVIGSVGAGYLMDRICLEAIASLTLIFGITCNVILTFYSNNYPCMMFAFCIYSLFRQTLYPVFIGGLITGFGFRCFGVLSGIGFFLSGIAQLFMAQLVQYFEGDCHLRDASTGVYGECDTGRWKELHIAQIVILFFLLPIPIIDYMHNYGHHDHYTRKKLVKSKTGYDAL